MSNQISNHPEHEEIFSLLPWYVNRTLDGHKRQAVSSHIKHCDECQHEIRFLQSLSETVTSETQDAYSLHADVDKSLASVMNRIDEKSHQSNTGASETSSLFNRVGEFFKFATTLPMAQWGVTAMAGLLVAVLGFQMYFSQSNDGYSVLSSSDITEPSMRLSVEMTTTIDQQQAQSIIVQGIEKYGQQIAIEAIADDNYTIVFKDPVAVARLTELIADLERETQIKRVEILP